MYPSHAGPPQHNPAYMVSYQQFLANGVPPQQHQFTAGQSPRVYPVGRGTYAVQGWPRAAQYGYHDERQVAQVFCQAPRRQKQKHNQQRKQNEKQKQNQKNKQQCSSVQRGFATQTKELVKEKADAETNMKADADAERKTGQELHGAGFFFPQAAPQALQQSIANESRGANAEGTFKVQSNLNPHAADWQPRPIGNQEQASAGRPGRLHGRRRFALDAHGTSGTAPQSAAQSTSGDPQHPDKRPAVIGGHIASCSLHLISVLITCVSLCFYLACTPGDHAMEMT
jgi:hypothetical protein